jgi:endonuclease YncB( thermonuclease family)
LATTVLLPHGEMDEKLRLRGIDCPEIGTTAGVAAKRQVQSLVDAAVEVVITTSKVDKYDRYLADVHLRFEEPTRANLAPPALGADGWLHLNNALLAGGYAERVDSSSAGDWVP